MSLKLLITACSPHLQNILYSLFLRMKWHHYGWYDSISNSIRVRSWEECHSRRPETQVLSLLLSCSVMFDSLQPHGLQHAGLPCPSLSPGVCSESCLLSRWCHPTIPSSVVPFSSCPRSFPAPGSFPMGQLFTSGDQIIRTSASVLLMNIQGWFPLGRTGLMSLLSKRHHI